MAMMISKFHKIIQSKIVWTVFAILISVAFVSVYTGAKSSGKTPNQSGKEVVGRLFGKDVSRREFDQAYHQVQVAYALATGRQLRTTEENAADIRDMAWNRLAIVKKAEQMDLDVTDEQINAAIRRQAIFRNPQTGGFDRQAYDTFVGNILPSSFRMDETGFRKMTAVNLLIAKASGMAVQGTLVTDGEIKDLFHLLNDKLTVEYAMLPRSLSAAPEITEEEAKTYFEQNKVRFIVPEKAMVKYVQYPVANYTNAVADTVTDEMIASVYENNKQRYLMPAAEDAVLPEYQPLEEVKGDIAKTITEELARRKATADADLLVAELADQGADFDSLAENSGLEVANVPKFSQNETIKGIDPTASFPRAAFALENNETHYYSDPVVGRDFVYVIALIKKFDAYLPVFDQVKNEVFEAARLAAAEAAYLETAESLHADIATALKAGMSFAEAAAKINLEVQTTDPVSRMDQPEDQLVRQLLTTTYLFAPGTMTDLIPAGDETMIAYVAEKTPADESELMDMHDQLGASIRADKARRLAAEWQDAVIAEASLEDLRTASDGDKS